MIRIELPADMGRDAAVTLAHSLAAAGTGAVLNGTSVTRIGQIGLQVLAAAHRDTGAALEAASPALAEALATAGLGWLIEGAPA
ncbi:hypothetical protein [Sandarakinorhabdus sp.]|uniref:hypothetical protein n=1 Tax=Sandarakinorhabdus sp. TaxID=1916663 RepID=UPI0033425AB3